MRESLETLDLLIDYEYQEKKEIHEPKYIP
jgi:hypothetical protein